MKLILHIKEKRFLYICGSLIVKLQFSYEEEESSFDKNNFFDVLIKSRIYQGYRWTHTHFDENAHGPFDIRKISPDHYQLIPFDELNKKMRSILLELGLDEDKYYRLYYQNFIDELNVCADLCFHLAIPLSAERYWSAAYRDLPVLDFFEEWIVIDRKHQQVHMIHLFRD